MEDNQDNLKPYISHCHCGLVHLTFLLAPLTSSSTTKISCNCSICTRNGYLLVYPQASTFSIASGESSLFSYAFGSKDRPHRFCGNCGSSMFIDFRESSDERLKKMVAVNLRMVPGIEDELEGLEFRKVDGKGKLGPEYSPSHMGE